MRTIVVSGRSAHLLPLTLLLALTFHFIRLQMFPVLPGVARVLDLQFAWGLARESAERQTRRHNDDINISLARLVRACLGAKLDKHQQCRSSCRFEIRRTSESVVLLSYTFIPPPCTCACY